jgi:hypothetical protein
MHNAATSRDDREETADRVKLEHSPRTELGRLAIEARRDYAASGRHFLDRAEIEREVANGRGSTHLLDSR